MPATDPSASLQRREAAAAPPPVDAKLATIRGRCVDAKGAPLAGVEVQLHGWEASTERMSAWLVEHERPDWRDPPPRTTGSDGTFSFTFCPPPPYQILCRALHPEAVTMEARWSQVAAGSTIDAGDVVMQPGAIVHGRVVDTKQVPRSNVALDFLRRSPPERDPKRLFTVRTQEGALSAADGSFRCRAVLPDGRYEIRVQSKLLQMRSPVFVVIDGAPSYEVNLVVADVPASAQVRGKVVDETAAPVPGANVTWESGSGSGGYASTSRDGSFVLCANEPSASERCRITASAAGFESADPIRSVAWGTSDLVVQLRRAGELLVHAVDPDGRPVARFSARLFAHGGGRSTAEEQDLRLVGPSADGMLTIAGVKRGVYRVVVEFPSASGLLPRFEMVEYSGVQRRLEVRAERATERGLRVVRADGSPVAGTKVQICELLGGTLDEFTSVLPRDAWFSAATLKKALVLQEWVTDVDGRCVLSGPAQVHLGLRVLGPGHVPFEDSTVRLDVVEPLVVTVAAGGVLRGQVVPAEAVAELARLERAAVASGWAKARCTARVSLQQDGRRFPARMARLDDPGFAVSMIHADGSFALTGVPTGEWEVGIISFVTRPPMEGEIGRSGQGRTSPGPRVVIREGETTDVEVDLLDIVPGGLAGQVSYNGAPLANAAIVLDSAEHARRTGGPGGEWINLRTDAQGRFEHLGATGTFELWMWSGPNQAPLPTKLRAGNPATVRRGETIEHTFLIASGRLQLLVLDANGRPAEGVTVATVGIDQELPASDEHGLVAVEMAAGTSPLRVLPKSLQSTEARQRLIEEAMAAKRPDAFAAHWLDLGTVVVVAGQTTKHEVRLPPSFDK